MNFEFSFVALILLVMLFVPNILWSRFPPKNYEKYSQNENKLLLVFERIGQVLVVVFSLFCGVKFSLNPVLLVVIFLMILYEIYWIRFFRSSRTMNDMNRSLFLIPLPGATLPVAAFLLLGIFSNNIFLTLSSVLLGIGHIGIHAGHVRELE
ncbi:hypothetical protein [Methanobrevibacter sp.]|uniref:hypothetical protein n=1 Tax=Methanobrevibacter sp. TaxID=66852 RepID=UPI0026DF16B8|nr:hypothetical protein [Methanobrevibacter sp.]